MQCEVRSRTSTVGKCGCSLQLRFSWPTHVSVGTEVQIFDPQNSIVLSILDDNKSLPHVPQSRSVFWIPPQVSLICPDVSGVPLKEPNILKQGVQYLKAKETSGVCLPLYLESHLNHMKLKEDDPLIVCFFDSSSKGSRWNIPASRLPF